MANTFKYRPHQTRAACTTTIRALKVQLCQVVRLSKGMVINKELGVRSFDNDMFNVAELAQIPTDYLFWSKQAVREHNQKEYLMNSSHNPYTSSGYIVQSVEAKGKKNLWTQTSAS
ncbi:hypothetical protein MRX96_031076 [Rhipicephalus microplus]